MPIPSTLLKTGAIVGNRYQILSQLGCGGFGCTYLAEDTLTSFEKCILKEFASPLETRQQVLEAEELFEQEAGSLKMLRHPQIPKFKELLRLDLEGENSLFLVQDYVQGQTYGELIRQGKRFNEAEVTQLLLNLLPVLEYVHSLNLVHRDISPDNLIQNPKGKPVLINFGCVKVAANAVLGTSGKPIILVGRPGYAPEEQLLYGQALPQSDLYALAVTVLVLMTGEPPQSLYSSDYALWNWEHQVKLTPPLAEVLTKMLAHQPSDRYRSARKVRKTLESHPVQRLAKAVPAGDLHSAGQTASAQQTDTIAASTHLPPRQHSLRWNIREEARQASVLQDAPHLPDNTSYGRETGEPIGGDSQETASAGERKITGKNEKQTHSFLTNQKLKSWGNWQPTFIRACAVAIPVAIAFAGIQQINWHSPNRFTFHEQTTQQQIYQRIKKLGINEGVFYEQVDRLFYARYPALQGTQLSKRPEHQSFRQAWYQIADNLLETLEKEQ